MAKKKKTSEETDFDIEEFMKGGKPVDTEKRRKEEEKRIKENKKFNEELKSKSKNREELIEKVRLIPITLDYFTDKLTQWNGIMGPGGSSSITGYKYYANMKVEKNPYGIRQILIGGWPHIRVGRGLEAYIFMGEKRKLRSETKLFDFSDKNKHVLIPTKKAREEEVPLKIVDYHLECHGDTPGAKSYPVTYYNVLFEEFFKNLPINDDFFSS